MYILSVALLWFMVCMVYVYAYEQVLLLVWKGQELLYIVYIVLINIAATILILICFRFTCADST